MSNKIRISYSIPGCFIGKDYLDYDSFEEVLNLEDFESIKGIDINRTGTTIIPKLPSNLLGFYCSYNNIELHQNYQKH